MIEVINDAVVVPPQHDPYGEGFVFFLDAEGSPEPDPLIDHHRERVVAEIMEAL